MVRVFTAVFLALLTVSAFAGDKLDVKLTDAVNQAYRTLLDLNNPVSERKKAVAYLKDAYVKENDVTVIDAINDLLLYSYDQSKYKEEDNKSYQSDMIALELVNILQISGQPSSFPALLNIVVKRNHAQATINAAWNAIKAIKWKDK
ncbi:MAG: hypothetical protein A2014_05065 [Spirochaetes bacterium GWF1_49_6]|jgi:hypothetical protein|nr:MAG: hypothetical protein A2014_05065 [Spirochaetes bacterium GWF1_49_6]